MSFIKQKEYLLIIITILLFLLCTECLCLPKFECQSLKAHWNGIWKQEEWDLDEVMRVEPPWQDYYPSKRHQKPCFLSLSTAPQKRSHMNTEKNNDHLEAKRRDLRMKPSYLYPDLGLPAYRTWKINIFYLSHLTYGIWFWKPNLTNIHQFSSKFLSPTSHY